MTILFERIEEIGDLLLGQGGYMTLDRLQIDGSQNGIIEQKSG